jgi:hypothetical protein
MARGTPALFRAPYCGTNAYSPRRRAIVLAKREKIPDDTWRSRPTNTGD